jgi:hypothetical protein
MPSGGVVVDYWWSVFCDLRGGFEDVAALLAGYPAPAGIGTQMTTQGTICKMVALCTQQGKSIEEAVDFAQSELEGFRRS